ncbi:hypothetical protein MHU86_22499 [Fragilaria crotonensis]|nr:hypothetical protein MHU86_22499 [Fragilaria crotonensis]
MDELLNGEEAAFSLLVALLERVSAPDQEAQLADALANAVETQVSDKEQQIRLLSALYNLRSRFQEKYALLLRMIVLAPTLDGRLGEVVDEVVPLLDGWSIGQAERRPLYKAIALKDGSRKQKFTLLLLQTYGDASSIDAEGLEAANEAAVGAIRDPVTLFHEQRSMLDTPAIKALASHAKELYGLLEVFQEGKLEDYRAFPNKDAVLAKYGLNEEECTSYENP